LNIDEFEKQVKDLDQTEILSGAISSLNKLLVDKRIVQEKELQDYFLEWMRDRKKGRNRARTPRGPKSKQ
jgi:hypothetical protein